MSSGVPALLDFLDLVSRLELLADTWELAEAGLSALAPNRLLESGVPGIADSFGVDTEEVGGVGGNSFGVGGTIFFLA